MRQVVLDTETTGLEPSGGHRIIEIGCVEISNRRLTGRSYHQYIQPDREVEEGAFEVHGISNEFLADKPRFAEILPEFLEFVSGAELIIHNAPFDVGFINHELNLNGAGVARIEDICSITDTLAMARRLHPGQKNNLDALCRRYDVDNSHRELHGALLDAQILADLYLVMTGGQGSLFGESRENIAGPARETHRLLSRERPPLTVIRADEAELAAHQSLLGQIDKSSGGRCVWTAVKSD